MKFVPVTFQPVIAPSHFNPSSCPLSLPIRPLENFAPMRTNRKIQIWFLNSWDNRSFTKTYIGKPWFAYQPLRSDSIIEAFGFHRTVVSAPRTGPWSLQRFDVLRIRTCCVQEPYKAQTVVPATNPFSFLVTVTLGSL
jgi:hypothetical protein